MSDRAHEEILLGRFRLVRKIAPGRLCDVFEAEDLAHCRRRVALKRVRGAASAAALEDLRREFDLLSRATHRHLPEVFDLHAAERSLPAFFTMELIEGQPFLENVDELAATLDRRAEPPAPAEASLLPARRWPFVGRRAELARVNAVIDRLASSDRPPLSLEERAFLVTGEAGIGKTRFLREVARACQLGGIWTFRTEVADHGGAALGAVIDCVRQVVAWARSLATADTACEEILSRHSAPLEQILRGEIPVRSPRTGSAEEHAIWNAHQAAQLLGSLSKRHPFCLLLDGMHHADSATVRTLDVIVRESVSGRFFTFLATRPVVEAGAPAASLSFSPSQTLSLAPLDEDALGRLVRALVPPGDTAGVLHDTAHRLTGGRPVVLDLLLREAQGGREAELRGREEGTGTVETTGWAGTAPGSLERAVERWMARLPETQQRVLEVLAVTGRPAPCRTIEQLLKGDLQDELAPEAIEEAVAELVSTGVLFREACASAERLSLSHAAAGEAIQARLEDERRKALHGAYASVLLAKESPDGSAEPSLLLRHLLDAGRFEEAAAWALEAGIQAHDRTALAEAEKLFGLALAHTRPDNRPQRIRTLDRIATVCLQRRHFDEALGHFRTLVREATEQADSRAVARGLAGLADGHLAAAEYEEADALAARALRMARDTGDTKTEARAQSAIADSLHFQSRLPEAKKAYERVVALQRKLTDPIDTARAWHNLGWVCHTMRDFAEATTYLSNAANIYRRVGNLPGLANAVAALGAAALDQGDFPRAVQILEEALEHAKWSRSRRPQAICHINLAQARLRLGRFVHALEDLDRARDLLVSIRNSHYLADVELTRGWVLTERGEYALSEEQLARSRESCLQREDQPGLAHCLAAQGNIHRLLGDATTARFWCERALKIARGAGDAQVAAVALTQLALAEHETGREQEAVDHLIEARSLAREVQAADTAHLADLALARVLVRANRLPEAASLLKALLERAEALQLAPDIPQILLLQAIARARSGDLPGAARLAGEGLQRAAEGEPPPEALWELRSLCLLLPAAEGEPVRASMLRSEADQWIAGCSARIDDETRRSGFTARARKRQKAFEALLVRPSANDAASGDRCEASDGPEGSTPEKKQPSLEIGGERQAPPASRP